MFRILVALWVSISLAACTSMRPLPPDEAGRWRGQVHVGDDVSVSANNGKTYLLTLTEVDDQKIVGIGDNRKVTIRYEQIKSLEVRRLSVAKTGGLVVGTVAALWLLLVLAFSHIELFDSDSDNQN